MALDPQRVPAQEIRRAGLVDIGDPRLRIAEGLAEPDQPLVGVQLEPYQVAVLGDLNGLERVIFMAVPSLPKAGSPTGAARSAA